MDDVKKALLLIILLVYGIDASFGQDCNITSKANDILPDRLCAPVNVSWKVTYRGVNDGGTGNVKIQFDWDDGNPPQLINAIENPTSPGEWEATHFHTYPIGGLNCNYHPEVYLVVDGVLCTSSVQTQNVTVWDTDDQNGGDLIIDPQVYPICVGNDGMVIFNDISQWNCTPPDENDVPNEKSRWIQWKYGTGGTNITTAEVNGIIQAYPFSGSINKTSEPIWGPTAPFNQTESIYIPAGYNIGDFFEVTLRNWNACNPYDDPTLPGPPADPINGDYPPVETTAIALIVGLPDGSITAAGPFCEYDAASNLTAATPGGTWSGPGIVDPANGTFDPATAGPGDHIIDYVINDANGCSATGSTSIKVLDAPEANITDGPSTNLCPGTSLSLDGNPTGGSLPYTHFWTGDTGPLSDASSQTPSFQTTTVGSYTLTYRVTDNQSCWSEDVLVIDVDSVNINFSNKLITLCTDVAQSLQPNPTGGSGVYTFHEWRGNRTDLLSATNVENPTFSASTEGLYGYEYYILDSQGCEKTDSIFVQVYQQPASNAGPDESICGTTTTLKGIASSGTGVWNQISGPGSISFTDLNLATSNIMASQFGSYELQWSEDNNGCTDADQVTLTFYQIPEPTVGVDRDTCGLEYPLEAFPDIGTGSWHQTSGPGTASFANNNDPKSWVTVDSPGDYRFVWLEDNGFGCWGSDTLEISFYPVPTAGTDPFDPLGCNPVNIDFNNTSSNADSYFWSFGDGFTSNQEHPSHLFRNLLPTPETYSIELIAYNTYGCTDTLTQDLTVAPTPISRIAMDQGPGCSPLIIQFENRSEGASSYQWDMGDGSPIITDTDVNHTYTNSETFVKAYEVILVAENTFSCTDTSKTFVTVYPLSNFNLTATPSTGCSPLTVEFTADPGAFSYEWHFGDGQTMSGINALSHIYENNGNAPQIFDVQLNTSSVFGCLDTTYTSIEVAPSPKSQFSSSPLDGCAPLLVDFVNTSTDAVTSLWKFGDGNELSMSGTPSASHSFENNAFTTEAYTTRLIVENSYACKDSSQQIIRVYPLVTAQISDGEDGCSPLDVSFSNTSTGANSFYWDYGDGNNSNGFLGKNIFTNFTNQDITYQVSLTASSAFGCQSTDQTSVTVFRTPQPKFVVSPVEQQMPQSTVTLNNQTTGNNWTYLWDFGDGQTSAEKDPAPYTYTNSGDFNIELKVSGTHCSDSSYQAIRIIPSMPSIDYGPSAEGCPPLNVQFYNNTLDAHNFMWEFGDGNISSEKEPEHTFYSPGTYRIKLTAYGPGGVLEAEDVVVKVYDKPSAFFEAVPRVVKIPGQSVSFLNKSIGATSSLWHLGDGNTSTEFSLMYEYQDEGIYDVSLEVTNDMGCKDQFIQREAVIAELGGNINFPNAFTPNPSGSNGGRYVYGEKENYVFYPSIQEGVAEYKLQIFTRWGELIFESHDIKIGWDGYYRGKLAAQGVYIYRVECRFGTGALEVKTGDVTLIR
jgi:gliding motility-associated-like protein